MEKTAQKTAIEAAKTYLGIELGSTRIKAMLIGEDHATLASGGHDWENSLIDGFWTYSLEEVWSGLQACYRALAADVYEKYGMELTCIGAMGISAMMHGYLPFDREGELLAAFRTWRNTTTERAAQELTQLFSFNIPQRWSVAHLFEAILNGEEHVGKIDTLTTLAGYVHWRLTGKKVLGIGDASGMFPIDSTAGDFDSGMIEKFDDLIAPEGYDWKLKDILPRVLTAGQDAGELTQDGALLLDPTGKLGVGVPLCPPEGDAGTGMTATNSVEPRTGNVSAGTSIFAMIVLERPLSRVHMEIDMVTTPGGSPVAMVHCNNCSSDIDAWAGLFHEFGQMAGVHLPFKSVLDMLYYKALEGEPDCAGLLSYNYFSGEPITGLAQGRPLFARMPESRFTLANFMRTHLQSALATLKIGLDILRSERVKIERMYGHGGYFKAKGVGTRLMASAIDAPVYVMETAGEGGAWGAAVLAAYLKNRAGEQSLEDYLNKRVFAGSTGEKTEPERADVLGFETFMGRYVKGLAAERAAVESIE